MNCLPVIDMEMRSASRRNWTFRLRLLFALAGASACLIVLILPRLAANQKGHVMLVILSYLSLGFCLTVGGFLTADCVSSEKREGTLGLLFLTPLKGTDIVLGKMVCHGLQVLYGLCALFPVFFLPLLAGGVTWGEVSRILLALGLALLLAESVGVLVSVFAMEARRVMLATLSTVALISALPMIYWLLWVIFLVAPSRPLRMSGVLLLSPIFTVFSAFESNYVSRLGHWAYWLSVVAILVLSMLAVSTAGALLGRVFAKMGSTEASGRMRGVLRLHKDILERNPYEWLMRRNLAQGHSVGVLIGLGVGLFVVMLVASVLTSHWQEAFSAAFFTALAIHLTAKLRFAVETTRQINTDYAQRRLELLLVTTLSEANIVEGHHQVLRGFARKPLVLLITLNLLLELSIIVQGEPLHIDKEAAVVFSSFFLGGILLAIADFSALRWMGLLHGLKTATQVKATLTCYGATMLLPWVGMGLVISIIFSTEPRAAGAALILSAWVGACLWYDWLLVRLVGLRLQGGLRRLISEGT